MSKTREKILRAFRVEDLENPITKMSIAEALENVDEEEAIKRIEAVEMQAEELGESFGIEEDDY